MDVNGYSIIRQVYGGGYTHISVAHAHDGRQLILRELKEEYCTDRRIRHQFLRGATIQAQLNHPAIPKVIEINKFRDHPFMTLEQIYGQSLRKLLLHDAEILNKDPLDLIIHLAYAIQHVHAQGFLHLDIKPENILVSDDGSIHLIDFDLALKFHGRPRKIKRISGTRSYMAPEVFQNHQVDEQSDIYSFGITAFEILSHGHKPSEIETPEKSGAPFHDDHQALRHFCPQIPPRLEAIINKCIAENPSIRYPSMHLIINDLSKLI